jgi:hypothetical protein
VVGSRQHRAWIAYCKEFGVSRDRNQHAPVYDPKRHPAQARKFIQYGATDFEVAEALGVTNQTIMRWKAAHPEFAAAMKFRDEDGVFQDDRVKRALLHRAAGYSFRSEKIVVVDGEVTRVPVVEHVPPSDAAMKFYLQNRDPAHFNLAKEVNINSAASLDVTITRGMDPRDAMEAFMRLLKAPSAARTLPPLVVEPSTVEPPVGDPGAD